MKTLSAGRLRRLSILSSGAVILLALAVLLRFPADAAESARRGLAVCGKTIVPSLLPFFVLSGLFSAAGLPQALAGWAEPLMRRAFGVSGQACAPFLLGLTGGYPMGAAATAELVKSGALSPAEGERLLPFCNNTGPAFIIGAAGSGVFGSVRYGAVLYVSHILAAVGVGLLFSSRGQAAAAPPAPFQPKSLAQALPESMRAAVSATLNICGYVVFFSVVTGLLDAAGVFSSLAGTLSAKLGLELHVCRSLLTGILELGSGIASLEGLAPTGPHLALAAFILGFGGLSVHCQTLAVVADTEMRCARHFAGRILHGVLSALFAYLIAVLAF
ncbi:MAG: nucleoside recognition domain-containing protein [Oscillospiraceae bacterium]